MPEGHILSFLSLVPHGSILDISNAMIGILYYSTIFLMDSIKGYPSAGRDQGWIFSTVVLNGLAMSVSVYLALKLLYWKEVCILCLSTHTINFLLLRYHWSLYRVRQAHAFKKE
jgi:uncharacterized membrane protein